MMWWWGRSPLKDLDDLPDTPRLGVNLIIGGLAILAFRYAWPRVALASFQQASAFVFRHSPQLQPAPDDLSVYLVIVASMCLVCGAFIFFRRGVWWWSEWRNERDIIRLKLR
jgi:hypothetical protein